MTTQPGNQSDGRQKAIIISAFAASGKTWLAENSKLLEYSVHDLDSSAFSKVPGSGESNTKFQTDYLEAISPHLHEETIILVSTHDEIREAMIARGWKYTLVYPKEDLKEEWLARLRARGSLELATMMAKKWSTYVNKCKGQRGCKHVELGKGEYLFNVVSECISRNTV